MKRKIILQIVAIGLTIVFQSCKDETEENFSVANKAENSTIEFSENYVEITRKQAEIIDLQWEVANERNLDNSVQVTGMLELFPQDKANISPFIGGNVKEILVIEGDKVAKGAIMAYLEHPDIISLQQEFQQNQNELQFLERDYERKKTLYDKGVSSGKEFQNAESKFKSMQSSVKAIGEKIKLLGLNLQNVASGTLYPAVPVRTPITGFVDEVMVNLGDYIEPQSKMFAVSDNSKIHLDLKVYEKDIRYINEKQQIYFTVTSRPDEIMEAEIHSIGKTFENEPKAVHVHAHLDNKDKDLLPGMYVEGRIVRGEQKSTAVPEAAIVQEGEDSFIFVLDEKNTDQDDILGFKQVKIQPGTTDLGFVAIQLPAEISKDTPIVTQGAYALSSEINKSSAGHEH